MKTLALVLMIMVVSTNVFAEIIDMEIIKHIESSGNPLAYNVRTNARGWYQITPICLKEYNNFHKVKYTQDDLFDPMINEKIANWYMLERIPQMIKHYGFTPDVENMITAWNAGISYVIHARRLPRETRNFIKKYKEADNGTTTR